MTDHPKTNLAPLAPAIAFVVLFMSAFSWAALKAEAELAAADKARVECVTDIECCTAWGDC